jgi:hypothetical protein
MAEKYMFFDSTADDPREYPASNFAEFFGKVLTSGIFNGGTNLQVGCTGTDMKSVIEPGYAWINGYMYKLDADLQLTHDAADPGADRIDRVVIRLDTRIENRYIKAFILGGTPAVSPVAPSLTRDANIYEISLAQVLIRAGRSYIEPMQITDERLDASVCGLVNSLIQVDTAAMQAAFDAFLESLSTSSFVAATDYTLLVPYGGTTTNIVNAYSIATPAISALTAGMAISVKINSDSSGPATLNWNGKGAKAIKRANGNDAVLKANAIYTMRYNGTNFILQGEGASGDATASDLLSGKTADTDAGPITGTMPDRAGDTVALSSSITGTTLKLKASEGYRDGVNDYITITDADFVDSNIKNGINIFGKVGSYVSTPFNPLVAGSDTIIISNSTVVSSSAISWSLIRGGWICQFSGTVRVSFDLSADFTHTGYGRIYKNGVAVGTVRTSNTGAQMTTFTEDITVNANDELQFYGYIDTSPAQVHIANIKMGITISNPPITKGT